MVGADSRTRILAQRLAPGSPFAPGPFTIHGWAASSGGADRREAEAQAAAAGTPVAATWEELATEPAVRAVYVGGPHADRARVAATALEAGKAVLCPLPLAVDREGLETITAAVAKGGGILLAPSDLGASLAGRGGLAAVRNGELGALHAIFLASRVGGGTGGDLLDELGWEALDFILACAGSGWQRAYAASSGPEATLFDLRLDGDVLVTGELSRLLPAPLAAAGQEVEVEIAGADAALRIEPYRRTVDVFRSEGSERRHWPTRPVIAMLEDLAAAIAVGKGDSEVLPRQRTVLEVMAALRAALNRRDAVAAGS